MFAGPGTYVSVNLTRRIKTVTSVALEWANFRTEPFRIYICVCVCVCVRKPGIKSAWYGAAEDAREEKTSAIK